ncbi:MAG: putative motility protein [Planctomycetaceae bacterium]|nr:putative motility protein [Planctomycetaceae bacterium]
METLINNASQLQQQQITLQTQIGVAKKTLDMQRQVGEAIVSLIDTAASRQTGKSPYSGKNLDVTG